MVPLFQTSGWASSTTGVTTDIWPVWVRCSSSSRTAATTAASTLWGVESGISAAATTVIWTNWVDEVEQAADWQSRRQRLIGARAATREELKAGLQRTAEAEAERARARERAEAILHETLSPKQREELQQKGYFEIAVLSNNGETRHYRIRRGRSRNVQRIDPGSGRVLHTLCAHPVELVPDADTMLAQKLMLESAEADFLRMANVS